MKAIVFRKYGPPDVLRVEEVEKPAPKDDEVLVKIHAATVATADCEARSFTFPLWFWLPLRLMFGVLKPRKPIQILGQELAGEIEAVGKNVKNFKKGDQVFAAIRGFGAHAEYKSLPASGPMATMPANLPYEEAVTFTVFALNALHFIRKADLQRGQKILINGAGSSIGTTAVQLAKHYGAEVTAVDSAGKLDMLRAIGATQIIDFAKQDFTKNGVTYDVILDVIGKSSYSRSLKALSPEGRYILANPKALPMLRGQWTNRTSAKKVMFEFAGEKPEDLLFLKGLIEAGALKAVIDRRYRMEEIVEAHAYVASGQKKGHVILAIEHDD